MVWGYTKILQRQLMLFCRVSGVAVPAVAGMLLRQIHHQPIAPDFRDDRSGRDREAAGIALDDAAGPALQCGRNPVAIDQNVIGRAGKPRDGAFHRQHRGMQDVDAVDLFDAGLPHRDIGGPPQLVGDDLAAGVGQAFRIIQTVGDRSRIKPDGRGNHGTSKRTASNFVNPDNIRAAVRESGFLETEIGSGMVHVVREARLAGARKSKAATSYLRPGQEGSGRSRWQMEIGRVTTRNAP